jgi:hypothetical protein
MIDEDPERLAQGADSPLRSLIEAGRNELATDAQLTALATRLGPILGGGGGGSGGGAAAHPTSLAATKAAAGISVSKAIAVALLGAATVATLWQVTSTSRATDPPPVERPSANLPPTGASVDPLAPAPDPSTPAMVLPFMSAPPPKPSPPPPNLPTAAASPNAGPVNELQLLRDAAKTIRENPTEALALCNRAAERFPKGSLAEERETIAIQALVALGRADDAKARAAAFRKRYPQSAFQQRIDQILSPP